MSSDKIITTPSFSLESSRFYLGLFHTLIFKLVKYFGIYEIILCNNNNNNNTNNNNSNKINNKNNNILLFIFLYFVSFVYLGL